LTVFVALSWANQPLKNASDDLIVEF
jgi:hypothetical protein